MNAEKIDAGILKPETARIIEVLCLGTTGERFKSGLRVGFLCKK